MDRTRPYLSLAVALSLGLSACDTTTAPDASVDAAALDGGAPDGGRDPRDGGAPDAHRDDAAVPGPDYLERIETDADYTSLAGEGDEVKFLTVVDGREPVRPETCLFQNTARFPFHIQFLRAAFPEQLGTLDFDTYVAWVLRAPSRRLWGGGLDRYERITHPLSGAAGIATYSVYQSEGPGEDLSVEQIAEVDARLKACAPGLASRLVFVPSGSQQEAHVRTIVSALNGRGVAVRFPAELVEAAFEPYSEGESYGYLAVVPEGSPPPDDYGPRDVLVLEAAPTDITTVGGMITALPQNIHSHVNLRLREKSLPNAMLASVYDDASILALDGQLVHVVVSTSSVRVEAASLADAEAFWAAHHPVVGPLRSDLSVTELAAIEGLEHDDAIAYGVKAANLGELHAVLPPENRAEGFAIPFATYHAFAVANGVDTQLATLLADDRLRTDRAFRTSALEALRSTIRRGDFPPGSLEAIQARIHEVFGDAAETTFLRFRSSTNAEDLEAFSGAGLYDSRTGCLGDDLDGDDLGPSRCLTAEHAAYLEAELAARTAERAAHPERYWLDDLIADLDEDLHDEKPVDDAIRKVWRSLFNLRAFDERDYYGLDHTQVYMGIAVHPSFVMERQESVAITNLRPDAGEPLYRVVTQLGEVGVVRPIDPTAVPETLTFRRGASGATDVRIVVPSSLAPGGTALYSDVELATLESLLFLVHDHFATNVYPDLAALRLDVEIEVTHDGRIVLKQARPYLGVE